MDVLGWRIYYSDGSTACSRELSWEQAACDGIQVVVVFYAKTYQIHRNGEWLTENYVCRLEGQDYYWQDARGFGCGTAKDVPEGASVKLGRYMTGEEFMAVYNRALQDSVY